MPSDLSRVSAIVTWIATMVAGIIAVALPGIFFTNGYEYLNGRLTTEGAYISAAISEFIGTQTDLWRYEEPRLRFLLFRMNRQADMSLVIRDMDGALLAKTSTPIPSPVIVQTTPVYDFGEPVATLEVAGSYRFLLVKTGFVALGSLALGLVVFFPLRTIPLRRLVEATARLARERERFRTIFDGSADAILVFDAHAARIEEANRAACDLLGYSRDELLSLAIPDISAEPQIAREDARQIVDGNHVHGPQRRFKRKDGTVVPIEIATSVIEWHGEQKLVAFVRDVSSRIELETRARQLDRIEALGNLAGGVAHELNNMLLPILTLTEMTRKRLPEESRDRAVLDRVVLAAQRARDIVGKVLSFSRMTEPEWTLVDIAEVVSGALDLVRSTLPSSITLREEILPDTGRIRGDAAQIETIMVNLISNAVDAINGAVGRIAVVLNRVDSAEGYDALPSDLPGGAYAKLSLSDTGKGIDAETQRHLFDPFFTTKEVGTGTGLGLAMVHGIVKQHRGAITFTSETGKGTTFDVFFPLAGEEVSQAVV